jgi:hypothetical protein
MHAPCQFVPQAAWHAKEPCFQRPECRKKFRAARDRGGTGLTTLVAATSPPRPKITFSHGKHLLFTDLVTRSLAW